MSVGSRLQRPCCQQNLQVTLSMLEALVVRGQVVKQWISIYQSIRRGGNNGVGFPENPYGGGGDDAGSDTTVMVVGRTLRFNWYQQ